MTKLPDGWEIKRLDEIADIVMGQSPPGSSYNEHGEGQPFFQGKTEFGEVHPTVRKYTTAGTKFAKAGDILMSVRAPVGPTNIADIDCVIGRGLAAIRAKTVVSQDYLRWSLKHLEIDIQSKGTGTTFDAITGETLRGTLVALPPIDEQHKIVEILEDHLSRLDAALADVKQAKLKAAQFRNVYIDDFLKSAKGIKTTLGSVSQFNSGFAYKSSIWQDSGVPVIKIMNVKHREVNLEGCSFVSEEIAESSKNFAVKKGDLLFNMTGATLGAFGFYNLELEARMNQRVGKFVPLDRNELNLNYLAYFLEAASTQRRIQQLAKGAAQPNISPTDILSLEICLPKIEMQNAIVEELDAGLSKVTQVGQLCNITKVDSNILRRSLLQAALTGQLTKEIVSV
jgi:type I restriction enzyme S subunit